MRFGVSDWAGRGGRHQNLEGIDMRTFVLASLLGCDRARRLGLSLFQERTAKHLAPGLHVCGRPNDRPGKAAGLQLLLRGVLHPHQLPGVIRGRVQDQDQDEVLDSRLARGPGEAAVAITANEAGLPLLLGPAKP